MNGSRWIHPGQNRARSIPIFPRTLVAGALSLIALSPTVGLAASNHVACAVPFIVGTQTCYSPSQEQVAGHRVTWAMSPNQAVHLTFGLPLSQVSVERLSRNDTEIDYMYGPLRYDYGRQGQSPICRPGDGVLRTDAANRAKPNTDGDRRERRSQVYTALGLQCCGLRAAHADLPGGRPIASPSRVRALVSRLELPVGTPRIRYRSQQRSQDDRDGGVPPDWASRLTSR